METTESMVIVGAGQCGARAAHALRRHGWDGPIVLLGEEQDAPYERPPLSKQVLMGNKTTQQCALFDHAYYRDQRITLQLATRVAGIDRQRRHVTLADGRALPYRRLLIATGAEPRTLDIPGATLSGVHVLRDARDAQAIAAALTPGRRVAVVGAGFIGMEVAASAIAQGCEVVVLEAGMRPLMRAVPEAVATALARKHRQKGVDLRCGIRIERIVGVERVTGVQLGDGTTVNCDVVVVGIGVTPRDALARQSGLDVENGIAVDETLRTSDLDIFAAGDACSFIHPVFGRRMRLESWKNAEDQADVAARNMLGANLPFTAVPWFWSDQYELTIQVAGMPMWGTQTVLRETAADSQLFFAIDEQGAVVGASGVGLVAEIARDVRVGQELIARGARVDPVRLADRTVKLKSLLASEHA